MLFVCSGNTCRSPMAAAALRRERPSWDVGSAGLSARGGDGAMPGAVRAVEAAGLRLTDHRAQPVTAELLAGQDVVLTMTEEQRRALVARFAGVGARTLTLADAAGAAGDVDDPYGGSDEAYARTFAQIQRLVATAAVHLSREAPLGRVVAAGADHAGWRLKDTLVQDLREQGFRVVDHGTHSDESTDYPDFARAVAEAVSDSGVGWGVLVCGTGLGMSIAANKVHGVRAAAVSDVVSARFGRAHNDANIVCVGARIVGVDVGRAILRTFAVTPWEDGRHRRRLDKVRDLERGSA